MRSEFTKNFIRLFSGTVLGQLLPILITPIITRIYTPNDIGEFSIYFGFFSTISAILCLKMEQVIVIPQDDSEAQKILVLCLKISALISIICLCVLLGVWCLKSSFGRTEMFWFFLPFQILFYGWGLAYSFFFNRYKEFSKIGISKIISGGIYPIFQLVLFKLSVFGLVIGFLAGSLASFVYVIKVSKNIFNALNKFVLKLSKVDYFLLRKYKNYPIYTVSNSLVNSFSNNLPLILLGRFYTVDTVAFYSWSNRIIQAPMGFIIYSLHQVFYQRIAENVGKKIEIFSLVKKIYYKLFLIGIVPYSIMLFFAPDIFSFVFGVEWRIAGVYTQFLTPWFFLVFLNSPVTSIVQVLNKQKNYLINEVFVLIARSLSLIIGGAVFRNPLYTIIAYGSVGVLYNIYLLIYLLTLSRKQGSKNYK